MFITYKHVHVPPLVLKARHPSDSAIHTGRSWLEVPEQAPEGIPPRFEIGSEDCNAILILLTFCSHCCICASKAQYIMFSTCQVHDLKIELRNIKAGLHNTSRFIQEPKDLKESIKALYRKHLQDYDRVSHNFDRKQSITASVDSICGGISSSLPFSYLRDIVHACTHYFMLLKFTVDTV